MVCGSEARQGVAAVASLDGRFGWSDASSARSWLERCRLRQCLITAITAAIARDLRLGALRVTGSGAGSVLGVINALDLQRRAGEREESAVPNLQM